MSVKLRHSESPYFWGHMVGELDACCFQPKLSWLLKTTTRFPRAHRIKKKTCIAWDNRSTHQQHQIRAVWCVSAAYAFSISRHTCMSSKSEANASNTKEEVWLDGRAKHAVTTTPLTLSILQYYLIISPQVCGESSFTEPRTQFTSDMPDKHVADCVSVLLVCVKAHQWGWRLVAGAAC